METMNDPQAPEEKVAARTTQAEVDARRDAWWHGGAPAPSEALIAAWEQAGLRWYW
jgi:hypothetical protein